MPCLLVAWFAIPKKLNISIGLASEKKYLFIIFTISRNSLNLHHVANINHEDEMDTKDL